MAEANDVEKREMAPGKDSEKLEAQLSELQIALKEELSKAKRLEEKVEKLEQELKLASEKELDLESLLKEVSGKSKASESKLKELTSELEGEKLAKQDAEKKQAEAQELVGELEKASAAALKQSEEKLAAMKHESELAAKREEEQALELKSALKKASKLEDSRSKLEELKSSLESQLGEKAGEIESLSKKNGELEEQLKRVTEEHEIMLKTSQDRAPELEDLLREARTRADEAEVEVKTLEIESEELRVKISAASTMEKILRETLFQVEVLREKHDDLQGELEKITSKLQEDIESLKKNETELVSELKSPQEASSKYETELKTSSKPGRASSGEFSSRPGTPSSPVPRVNPSGSAEPREMVLQERGQDWRMLDLHFEEEVKLVRSDGAQKDELVKLSESKLREAELLASSLRDELGSAQGTVSELENKVASVTEVLERKISEIQKSHGDLELEKNGYVSQVTSLREKLGEFEGEFSKTKEKLQSQLASMKDENESLSKELRGAQELKQEAVRNLEEKLASVTKELELKIIEIQKSHVGVELEKIGYLQEVKSLNEKLSEINDEFVLAKQLLNEELTSVRNENESLKKKLQEAQVVNGQKFSKKSEAGPAQAIEQMEVLNSREVDAGGLKSRRRRGRRGCDATSGEIESSDDVSSGKLSSRRSSSSPGYLGAGVFALSMTTFLLGVIVDRKLF